jgi:RHS repeat-associated protein
MDGDEKVNGKFDPSKTVTAENIAPYISTIRTIWTDGDETTGSLTSNYYTFTGRRSDPESELMYFRNRYYAPELGRFVGRDSLGYLGGTMNLYEVGFVPGSVDPAGLKPFSREFTRCITEKLCEVKAGAAKKFWQAYDQAEGLAQNVLAISDTETPSSTRFFTRCINAHSFILLASLFYEERPL